MTSQKGVHLLVGTHKGAFVFSSNLDRKKWAMQGPFFKGTDVHHMILDTRKEPTMFACVNSSWWGSDIRWSTDFGKTWHEPAQAIRFEENSDKKINRIWYVALGNRHEPDALYAGVDPGALFKSNDNGRNWYEVKSLTNHGTREHWLPGAGGLMVHSICIHPEDTRKLHVGISAAGTFSTEDGGDTWEPRNKGVLVDFLPEKNPEVGQCVHRLELHPNKPDVLYQQNHCGVYRSDNAGKDWIDLCEGLPSRFGFPLQIHPHDPDTIYVIPEEGPEFRCPVNGEFAVFRSRNRGESWQRLDNGLPRENAFLNIFRHAMTADKCDPCGIYFGTSTGQLFYSRNDGDTWELLANWFPPIFSVGCAVI